MDHELAQLLGEEVKSSQPDFSDLFQDENSQVPEITVKPSPGEELNNVSQQTFPTITRFQQKPARIFFEKDFYSRVLEGGNEQSERIHKNLQRYIKTKNPDERSVIRQQLIPAWWDLVIKITGNFPEISSHKRFSLRFGYLLPQFLSETQRKMIASIIPENSYGEPVHYFDDWLELLSRGEVSHLALDEIGTGKKTRNTPNSNLIDKARTEKETNLGLLNNAARIRLKMETQLSTDLIPSIANQTGYESKTSTPYTESQKSDINQAIGILKKLLQNDAAMRRNLDKFQKSEKQLENLDNSTSRAGVEQSPENDSNIKDRMEKEINTLRQIAKLCVGRQGNHFPFLMKNFFGSEISLVGTRENIICHMKKIESVDPEIFIRQRQNQTNRIVPHTIIIPCFGNYGVCWEAFERTNRATSRGRIAIPMFPRDLSLAVTCALGDLRWNTAKEKAAHYWMEEGLTGRYYQYFVSARKRGDVRNNFLEDYILWITKECQGIQKLSREARAIFWHFIPFTKSIRENLRNRGFVYDELYKKDINRSLKDGY